MSNLDHNGIDQLTKGAKIYFIGIGGISMSGLALLAKGYGFNGIPRFIFIDKNGKLIAGDAPKPSSENIIEYIESKLALSDK